MASRRVAVGLEVLVAEQLDLLRGRRVGLLAHAASVDGQLRHTIERLHAAGVGLGALFGPEHGLRGAAPPEEMVADAGDELTGLPVHSLYGERRAPTAAQLDEIDLLLVDLQDVGARFFTLYVTAMQCLRACAAVGKAVVVLDRPNPLGGQEVEGPILQPAYASFVGLPGLPIRHGLTLGELLRLLAARERLDLDLAVVTMRGWRRALYFDRTGLPWAPPSPNQATPDTALVYPGTCLVEATLASDGRGTAKPFEQVGAPGVPAERLAAALRDRVPGAAARSAWFVPSAGKHAGQLCGGVQLHVTDRRRFRPVAAGLALLQAARRICPEAFAWRPLEPDGVPWIDRLAGGPSVREALAADQPVPEVVASWRSRLRAFRAERQPFLLYD